MTRTLRFFLMVPVLLSACWVEQIDAIIAKYDTFGSTGSTGSTSSTDTSSTGSSSTAESASSGGDPAGSTASGEAGVEGSGTTTGDDTSGTGTTTTGPAAPVCGDSKVDPGETCDDGNDDPDDGCKLCAKDLRVFASSQVFQGGKIGSLYLADQRCRMMAAIAGLPNFATYRAWLSDSSESAAQRIFHSPGRYILVNGLVVAGDWNELTSGKLQNPINVTESSQTNDYSRAWTGTLPSGEAAVGVSFCDDWTDHSMQQLGGSGITSQNDGLWTFLEQDDCGGESGLYCFEQPPKP